MMPLGPQVARARLAAEVGFRWWTGTLIGMLPARWRAALSEPAPEFRIDVGVGGLRIHPTEGATDTADPPVAIEDIDLPELLRSRLRPGSRAVAVLAPELVMRRAVDLPIAAERELVAILAHEIDRLTPLAPEEARHDARVLHRDRAGSRLTAELFVAERRLVDYLDSAARTAGIELTGVTVAVDAASTVDLCRTLRQKPRRLRVIAALAVAAAGSLVLALLLQLDRYDEAVEAAQAHANRLRIEARKVEALGKEVAALAARRALVDQERARVPPLVLLGDIAAQLPDGSWLGAVALTPKEIRLSGWSPDATGLPPLLEDSGFLQGVRFLAPVTRDAGLKLDRFELVAGWRAPP